MITKEQLKYLTDIKDYGKMVKAVEAISDLSQRRTTSPISFDEIYTEVVVKKIEMYLKHSKPVIDDAFEDNIKKHIHDFYYYANKMGNNGTHYERIDDEKIEDTFKKLLPAITKYKNSNKNQDADSPLYQKNIARIELIRSMFDDAIKNPKGDGVKNIDAKVSENKTSIMFSGVSGINKSIIRIYIMLNGNAKNILATLTTTDGKEISRQEFKAYSNKELLKNFDKLFVIFMIDNFIEVHYIVHNAFNTRISINK